MGMYSAEMERMQALFSRLKEGRKIEYLDCCRPLSVVVLDVEIEGGVGEFDVRPQDVVEDREVCQGAARRFMVWSSCVWVRGDSVARESTRHVTAFGYSRLGSTRCYCKARKRKATATKLSCQVDAVTHRDCSTSSVFFF